MKLLRRAVRCLMENANSWRRNVNLFWRKWNCYEEMSDVWWKMRTPDEEMLICCGECEIVTKTCQRFDGKCELVTKKCWFVLENMKPLWSNVKCFMENANSWRIIANLFWRMQLLRRNVRCLMENAKLLTKKCYFVLESVNLLRRSVRCLLKKCELLTKKR